MITKEERFEFPFEKLEVYRLALELADFVFQLLEWNPFNRAGTCG